MRSAIYLLTIGLFCCSQQIDHNDNFAVKTYSDEERNIYVSVNNTEPTNRPDTIYNEYDLIPADSLFNYLDFELEEITAKQFESYEKAYRISCHIDSGGFINESGLSITKNCHEICQTYAVDSATGEKMILPADYDQGILGLIFSPSCNQFIIYSCYDLPSYYDYYQYRSEIIGFNITNGKGLAAIQPSFKYYTKDWSISDLIWIDDKTIALKVYEEGSPSAGNDYQHKYYKSALNK